VDVLLRVAFSFLDTTLALVRFAGSIGASATIARLTSKSPRGGKVGMAWKRLGIACAYVGAGTAAMVAGMKLTRSIGLNQVKAITKQGQIRF